MKICFFAQEFGYIKSTINIFDVPTVHLLVKDPKSKDKNGNYPSRLVGSAKFFIAAFPHVDQRGIKNILEEKNWLL